MKILIVSPYFYPYVGGLENYVLNTAKRLASFGHEVVVVTSNHEGKGRHEETVRGLRVIRLPIFAKLSNTPVNPAWRWQLKKIIRDETPDVVNAHTPVPYLADMAARAAKGKAKFVLTYHSDLAKDGMAGSMLAKLFYTLYINRTLRLSDEIIATSDYYVSTSRHLQKYSYKVSVVQPGFDPEVFNNRVDRTWLRKKYPGKRLVLITGQMSKTHSHKGVDILIDAVAKAQKKVPEIHLIVVGRGDNLDHYRALAAERGVDQNVTFTGYVPDGELARYFAGAHVFALPSKTASEGFGMVLLEASACGTPVVGSNIGGIPYAIVDGVTGELVPPNDARALSKTLVKILTTPKLAQAYGNAGAARARETFTWDTLVRKAERIFEQVRTRLDVTQVVAHFPPNTGGMEVVAKTLSLRLAQAGHNVTVVTTNVGKTPGFEDEHAHGYRVQRLRSLEIAGTPLIPMLFWRLLRTPKGAIFHAHLAQAFTPEVALVAAKLRGHRFVAHFHLDVAPSSALGFIFVAYKKTLFPWMLRHADRVVVFSDDQKALVHQKFGVTNERIVIIPNGADEVYFADAPRTLSKSKRPQLLFVGRLSTQKNVVMLLQALDTISGMFETTIVGNGELGGSLLATAKTLGLKHVTFTGKLVGQPLLEQYQTADVFVSPSEREGMPLVLIEALASGLPVVATNVIGTRDMIHDGKNGLLVPFGDVEALRAALLNIVHDPALYKRLSADALASAAPFSWSKLVTSFEQLYREVHNE